METSPKTLGRRGSMIGPSAWETTVVGRNPGEYTVVLKEIIEPTSFEVKS
ncbi:hypothetical protein [Paenarthrobacter ureafaciens]|nr:hypothetical protein [Paenarthrobacter ureafaciens]